MRPAGKTACLLLLFILISPLFSPLYAESFPDEELSDDGIFFLEELFTFEDAFSFEEFLMGAGAFLNEETLFDEESFPGDETLFSEETFSDEETFSGEETLPGEEIFLSEETPPAEGALPSEEVRPSEEALPTEETLLADKTFDKTFLDDDDFLDIDAFFFEAPDLIFEVPVFELRSFDTIFPNFSRGQRMMAMSDEGLRNSFVRNEPPTLVPNPNLGIDIMGSVMKKNPSHLIEALVVMPYHEKEFDLLDIYNALGRIGKIKDHPASLNDNDLYIFTESTRIESTRNRRAVSDPLPAVTLPFSETIYLRLKEINFGNLFIRADISISMHGITYSMTNFTDVRYFLVPIMKAERFITIIYLEPVKEGILIYSMSGFYMPGFIADKVNLTHNINRRIEIFINWINDGLRN
jgi:hypothetical protein